MASPIHDELNWYYNQNTGQIQHITNSLEKVYFDSLSYEVRFHTRAEAEAFKKQHPPSHQSVLDPTNPNNPIHVSVPKVDWTQFLSTLTQSSTWIRVAEVAIGVLLIAVGVAQMTHAVPAATKIARMVA